MDINNNLTGSPAREVTMRYYDGATAVVRVTDVETPMPDGRLTVSRTDPNGIITHVNQSFIDMSGYEEHELIGAPHYIRVILICPRWHSRGCGRHC